MEDERNNISKKKMDLESRIIIRKICFDLIILCCVGFPILFLFLWGDPFKRGFFCNDESLMHPFSESTVTNLMLYGIGMALPVLTMIGVEWNYDRVHASCTSAKKPTIVAGRAVPEWVVRSYSVIGVFAFGAACQQLTTDVAKYNIGRLRPHFMTVCKPNIDCTLAENLHKYHEDFACEGGDPKLLKDMRLSFPSGHSSFSVYCMIFFALYLHKRLTWDGSKLLRHGLQLLSFLLCWFTVMSRVSNYKHHWSDVMAGFFIGLLYAVLIAYEGLIVAASVSPPDPEIAGPGHHRDMEQNFRTMDASPKFDNS